MFGASNGRRAIKKIKIIKIKIILTSNKSKNKQMKLQGNYQQNKKRIEWEKIFANNMSDKGLT